MKRFLQAATLIFATLPLSALAAATIGVGQPGFHGVLDIGHQHRPRLVREAPVLVRPRSVGALARPLYVYVPPAHVRKWEKFCRAYNACGRPVYFVTEAWYEKIYVPEYREEQRRKAVVRSKATGKRKGLEF